MLNATLKIFKALVFLSHNIFLLTPIQSNLKSFRLQTSCKLYRIFSNFVWPLIIPTSLGITIFEFCYFCTLESPINLIMLLYHGTLIISKSSACIGFFVFKTSSLEFCQLLNAIFFTSFGTHKQVSQKRPIRKETGSNILFPFLLAGVAVFLLFFYFVAIPTITLMVPCFHKTPLTFWLGNCNTVRFRIVVSVLNFIFMIPIGSLGAMGTCCLCASTYCINKSLKRMK